MPKLHRRKNRFLAVFGFRIPRATVFRRDPPTHRPTYPRTHAHLHTYSPTHPLTHQRDAIHENLARQHENIPTYPPTNRFQTALQRRGGITNPPKPRASARKKHLKGAKERCQTGTVCIDFYAEGKVFLPAGRFKNRCKNISTSMSKTIKLRVGR